MSLSKDEKKVVYADAIGIAKTCMSGPWAVNVKDPHQLIRELYATLKAIREDVVQTDTAK